MTLLVYPQISELSKGYFGLHWVKVGFPRKEQDRSRFINCPKWSWQGSVITWSFTPNLVTEKLMTEMNKKKVTAKSQSFHFILGGGYWYEWWNVLVDAKFGGNGIKGSDLPWHCVSYLTHTQSFFYRYFIQTSHSLGENNIWSSIKPMVLMIFESSKFWPPGINKHQCPFFSLSKIKQVFFNHASNNKNSLYRREYQRINRFI